VDGDGDLDAAAGNHSGGQNAVYLNDGSGNFTDGDRNFGTGADMTIFLDLGDVDGDGDLDICSSNYGEQNVVYLNQVLIPVSIPDITALYNEILTVPVQMGSTTGLGIISAEVFVAYDGDVLTAFSVASSNTLLTPEWAIVTNIVEGVDTPMDTLKMAMATAEDALSGEGALIHLRFQVADIRSPASSALSLVHVLFNDGTPGHTPSHGSVTLVGTEGTLAMVPETILPRWPIQVTVTDADEDRDPEVVDAFDVEVSNDSQTETLTLTETGNSTGLFSGSLETVFSLAPTSGDGMVQAQAGDPIVVTYADWLDAAGATVARTDVTEVIGGTDGELQVTVVSQPEDTVRVRVTDADLSERVSVSVENPRTGESESILLSAFSGGSSVYLGRVYTDRGVGPGVSGDSVLVVQKADELVFTYPDTLTALGGKETVLGRDYVIDRFGDADGNGQVQAYDASRVLYNRLFPFLTGRDSLSANVDGLAPFGEITPFDAALILQYQVGVLFRFPVQEPASVNHPQPETAGIPAKRIPEERLLVLRVHDGYVSVWLADRAGIVSGELVLAGGRGAVAMAADLSDFLVTSQRTEDGLHLVFAGAEAGSGAGELVRLYPGMGSDPVRCLWARFNGGRIVADLSGAVGSGLVPVRFRLYANHPNPFNAETRIRFDLPRAAVVRLEVFDGLGQRVCTLVARTFPAGVHEVGWKGRDDTGGVLGSGIYFYRLQAEHAAGTVTHVRRMLLLK